MFFGCVEVGENLVTYAMEIGVFITYPGDYVLQRTVIVGNSTKYNFLFRMVIKI